MPKWSNESVWELEGEGNCSNFVIQLAEATDNPKLTARFTYMNKYSHWRISNAVIDKNFHSAETEQGSTVERSKNFSFISGVSTSELPFRAE